jgi:hypothetical protein
LTEVGNEAKYSGEEKKREREREIKIVFHTNLEHMFKCAVTNLDTQRTLTQQRLMCAKKCQVAAASTIQAIQSSSESTGDV